MMNGEAVSEPISSLALVGSRVMLTPFREELITEEYLGWLNDRDLTRYSKQRFRRHTRATAREYLRSFEETPNRFWSVQRLPDRRSVGTTTAYIDPHDRVADVGFLIGTAARGHGYGRDTCGLVMDFLFRHEQLRRVTGGTVAANVPMVRIFLHWGMTLEGVRRQQELIDGAPCDVLLFGILREEWERYVPDPLVRVEAA